MKALVSILNHIGFTWSNIWHSQSNLIFLSMIFRYAASQYYMSNGNGNSPTGGSPIAKPIAAPPQNVSFSVERLLSKPSQLHPNLQHLHHLQQQQHHQNTLLHHSSLHSLSNLSSQQSHPSPTSSEGSSATTPTPINSAGKVTNSINNNLIRPSIGSRSSSSSYDPYREVLSDGRSRLQVDSD